MNDPDSGWPDVGSNSTFHQRQLSLPVRRGSVLEQQRIDDDAVVNRGGRASSTRRSPIGVTSQMWQPLAVRPCRGDVPTASRPTPNSAGQPRRERVSKIDETDRLSVPTTVNLLSANVMSPAAVLSTCAAIFLAFDQTSAVFLSADPLIVSCASHKCRGRINLSVSPESCVW